MRHTAILAALWVFMAGSIAQAQTVTPGADAAGGPAIRAEIEDWLNEAELFRLGVRDMTQVWRRDGALLDVRTDIFADEVAAFAEATRRHSRTIQNLAPRNDAACILSGISADLSEQMEALEEANRQSAAAAVVGILNGIDRLVYEGFLVFGADGEMHAEADSVIRIGFMTAAAAAPARPRACDGDPA